MIKVVKSQQIFSLSSTLKKEIFPQSEKITLFLIQKETLEGIIIIILPTLSTSVLDWSNDRIKNPLISSLELEKSKPKFYSLY